MMLGNSIISYDNSPVSKIIRVGNSFLGTSGWSLYENIIINYIKKNRDIDFSNPDSIFSFFNKFWRDMRKDYSFVNDQSDSESSPFADLDNEFLIINQNGIFLVSTDMGVTKFEKYFAIGSGSI